ncbi:MAG TPA: aspartyl protease family protein [Sphingomonas sp.]|jgi:predicted aspartyl protease|uniref:aspartyl protease family protein n=1 Tax=Sphingomonas sp. TaxID=28214 RepID=UPI002EDA9F95
MSLLALRLLAALLPFQPVTIDPPAAPTADEILATGFDRADRMTVDVRLNGMGPFPFVIDTGADRSVLSTTVAAQLRLPPARPVTLHGIAGPEQVPTVRVARLQVGTGVREGIVAPVLSRLGLGADGLLGVDALADQRILLDFINQRMTVSPSTSRRPRDLPGTIVVTARRRFGQLILTDARLNGRKIYAVIDTGAENSIGNLALRRLVSRQGALGQPGLLVSVTGQTVTADMAVLPRVTIAGLQIQNMPIGFADIHSFARFGLRDDPAMLIGMDVLRGFDRVTIDFGHHLIRFGIPRSADRNSPS